MYPKKVNFFLGTVILVFKIRIASRTPPPPIVARKQTNYFFSGRSTKRDGGGVKHPKPVRKKQGKKQKCEPLRLR